MTSAAQRLPLANAGVPTLPCKAVIFDFDGTLSDSGDWFLSIADELADRFNFAHVGADEIELLRGKTTREVIQYLGIARWRLPTIARYVQARFGENVDKIHLFPGITQMIQTLHEAGIRIAICTSNNESNARAILGADSVARIETFECGASLFGKARKFRRVLKRLGTEIGDALSIGDETRDIAAARKLGLRSGAVLWGYANAQALGAMHPEAMFTAPGQIVEAILGPTG